MEQLKGILEEHGVKFTETPDQIQVDNIVELLENEITCTLEEIERERAADPRYVIDVYVPMLVNQLEAMEQIQHLAPENRTKSVPSGLAELMVDYALYVGHCSTAQVPLIDQTPMSYLEETMEHSDVIPSEELARDFLSQFYKMHGAVDGFMKDLGY